MARCEGEVGKLTGPPVQLVSRTGSEQACAAWLTVWHGPIVAADAPGERQQLGGEIRRLAQVVEADDVADPGLPRPDRFAMDDCGIDAQLGKILPPDRAKPRRLGGRFRSCRRKTLDQFVFETVMKWL
jgi:hypothetical protein